MTNAVENAEIRRNEQDPARAHRAAMQAYVDRGIFAGVRRWSRAAVDRSRSPFGWHDREAQTPMTADTIFRLYSMTKPIVCTALMTLFEEARFSLSIRWRNTSPLSAA